MIVISDELKEALLRLFREAGTTAVHGVEITLRHVTGRLQSPIERVTANALERSILDIGDAHKMVIIALDDGGYAVTPLCALWDSYQKSVMLLRDAGQAIDYDFSADGNFGEWKRADESWLRGLNATIARSDAAKIRECRDKHMRPTGGARQYWA